MTDDRYFQQGPWEPPLDDWLEQEWEERHERYEYWEIDEFGDELEEDLDEDDAE